MPHVLLLRVVRCGMGVVYKAWQVRLNRVVALKTILAGAPAGESDLARFLHEAEAIGQLQHPHIVQSFETGQHAGLLFFSLEFCPGGSCHAKLAGMPQPPRQAARLAEQLARGMAYAHECGSVHRDLKPYIVLLAEDDTRLRPGEARRGWCRRYAAGFGQPGRNGLHLVHGHGPAS